MAQHVQTVLVDDVTGREIPPGEGETITFSVGAATYEIDLDAKGAKEFHDTLAFYINHSRKVRRQLAAPPLRRGRKNEDIDIAAVRAWAGSNGLQISSRGRIKGEILEQYRAAMA